MPYVLWAQGVATVMGVVEDKATAELLPSVVIDMQYGGYASTSNIEGKFAFKFPNLVLDSSFVSFSAIGYKTRILPAKELMKLSEYTVYLEKADSIKSTLGIAEAKVLVQAAVDSIKKNNIHTNFFQNGFYQEVATIEGIGVVKVKEAVLRVERFPDEEIEYDKIRVTKSRHLDWKGQSSKIEAWQFLNGPPIASRTIETELPEFLNKRSLGSYKFRVDSLQTSFNGIEILSVSFEPKSSRLRGGRTGKIWIEPYSKAIVRLEYELSQRALFDVIGSGNGTVKLKGESLKFTSQYRLSGKKWVLHENVITVNLEYKEKLDKEFSVNTRWDLKFLATETRELAARMIQDAEIPSTTESFRSTVGLGNDYWDSYNFIRPTFEMLALPSNYTKR
ncbi:hypothetical protein DJ013_12190 [Arcticibacterium luteifluviistationis]|uniref:Carboxypeptidase-like regulatory domain-containing protein n=2 Tax=Arcticibacterium luteifluviistationis TaxID=1784714 RepID=A0A2Z4GCI8_9BACT|nr:hypothetical protein DJ013_12190 [Arcticibacterium luteifluviistationis]